VSIDPAVLRAIETEHGPLGAYVSYILRRLPPQIDNADVLHNAAETWLRQHGLNVTREYMIHIGSRYGFIDLVITDDGGLRVAIELDRRMPRAKSLRKLAAFDGYRIAVTRSDIPLREFECMVDEVIALPPLAKSP
jgi:hypothetical protein